MSIGLIIDDWIFVIWINIVDALVDRSLEVSIDARTDMILIICVDFTLGQDYLIEFNGDVDFSVVAKIL